MSKKHEVSLSRYLQGLSSQQKKYVCTEVASMKLNRLGQPAYIYQCIYGHNTPKPTGLICKALIAFSENNKVKHCYLTEESIKAGYLELDLKKLIEVTK